MKYKKLLVLLPLVLMVGNNIKAENKDKKIDTATIFIEGPVTLQNSKIQFFDENKKEIANITITLTKNEKEQAKKVKAFIIKRSIAVPLEKDNEKVTIKLMKDMQLFSQTFTLQSDKFFQFTCQFPTTYQAKCQLAPLESTNIILQADINAQNLFTELSIFNKKGKKRFSFKDLPVLSKIDSMKYFDKPFKYKKSIKIPLDSKAETVTLELQKQNGKKLSQELTLMSDQNYILDCNNDKCNSQLVTNHAAQVHVTFDYPFEVRIFNAEDKQILTKKTQLNRDDQMHYQEPDHIKMSDGKIVKGNSKIKKTVTFDNIQLAGKTEKFTIKLFRNNDELFSKTLDIKENQQAEFTCSQDGAKTDCKLSTKYLVNVTFQPNTDIYKLQYFTALTVYNKDGKKIFNKILPKPVIRMNGKPFKYTEELKLPLDSQSETVTFELQKQDRKKISYQTTLNADQKKHILDCNYDKCTLQQK